MVFKQLLGLLVLCSLLTLKARSQGCTVLGQSPATAFPVCGTSVFKQDSVPICNNGVIPVACNDGAQYSDKNPFWYTFTCFAAGTLGFTITPDTAADDYDWQIFDITGHSPQDVYSDRSLFVSGNWSSNPNKTGTSSGGVGDVNCAGPSFSNQNAMPSLILGHKYLLLVSHFTDTQVGYSLDFSGGTASITDTTPPMLKDIQPICDGSRIRVLLNKKMQCSSLAADGSDFMVMPGAIRAIGALSNSCSSGFDMDTVLLTFQNGLPPGNYSLVARNGTDNNTLLDNCGVQIPVGNTLSFTLTAPKPTMLDSLTPPSCAPDLLQLVFKKKIQCSSIAADGSDFFVTGSSAVTITGAAGNCDANGQSDIILVKLSGPIVSGGLYQIGLAPGTDGNTIIDECGLQTPTGAVLPFTLKDTVSAADFAGQILYGCILDTIRFGYPSENGVNYWKWIFDGTDTSLLQNPPQRIYSVFGSKPMQLIVSNGFCSDTLKTDILLGNAIDARFEAPNIICPKDEANFANNSTGKISDWNWDFGDGTGSTDQLPANHLYPVTGRESKYTISLIVQNSLGCNDTATQQIDVLKSCYIAVPSAFTPNGDGLNDYLYPLNAFKADNLDFRVFNRYGQMVFESKDYMQKWDGTINGHPQPTGTFVWFLQYTDRDTGRKFFQKGTTILIR